MPGSSANGKRLTVYIVRELARLGYIDSVLDIGPGAGTYSDLLRKDVSGFWGCVEIWGPYVKQYDLENRYDSVVIGDARFIEFGLIRERFGVTFLGDILEHVTAEEAASIVNRVLSVSGLAVISIPVVHAPQGEHFGNPFETHIEEDWSNEKVLAVFPNIALGCVSGGNIGVYFLTRWQPVKELLSTWAHTIDRNAIDALPLAPTNGIAPESEVPTAPTGELFSPS